MSGEEIGTIVLALSILIVSVHGLGFLMENLRQPRLVGEILAGVLLGPFFLGKMFPDVWTKIFGISGGGPNKIDTVLGFIYWIGLFLLMFISGSETRKLVSRENRRDATWLLGIGTPLPFFLVLGLGLWNLLPIHLLSTSPEQETSTLLVLAIAVAVTSIPVISRIFYDLKILHTRFAGLILSSAVLEDIILWGVLAVATSITGVKAQNLVQENLVSHVALHVGKTFLYMGLGLTFMPHLLKRLHGAKWNFLLKASPIGYLFFILFIYATIAGMMDVNLVFAAFLAGFGVVGGIGGNERTRFSDHLDSIARVACGIFVPLYFAMVGYKLLFGREFSFALLLIFLFGSSILSLFSVGLAARLAGFRKLDIVNLAITTNARGGPGIVLASIAYDAGIINSAFYTTLVLTAVLTSQAAGAWLRFVLSKGWPLLSSAPQETWSLSLGGIPTDLEDLIKK